MTTVIVHSAVSLLETCLRSIAIGSPVLMSRFSPAQWHALWTHPPVVASLMTIVGTADTTTIRVVALVTMMSAFNSCHCRDAAYVTGLLDTATSQLGYTPGDFSGTRDGGRPPIAQSATESGLVQLQRLVLAALNTGIRKSFGPVATKRPGFTPRDANPACGPGPGDAAAREGLAVLAADPALVVAAVDAFHLGLWDSELSDPNPTSGDSVLMLALVAPQAVLTGAPDLMAVVLRAMDELVARRRLAPDLSGHPLDECTRLLYMLTLVDPPRWRRLRSAPGTLAAVASWVDTHPPAVTLAEGSFPGAMRTGVLTLLHSHCVEPAGVLGCPAAVGVLVTAVVPRTTRLPPGAAAHGALIHLSSGSTVATDEWLGGGGRPGKVPRWKAHNAVMAATPTAGYPDSSGGGGGGGGWPAAVTAMVRDAGLAAADFVAVLDDATALLLMVPAVEYRWWPDAVSAAGRLKA
ncbi:hypothetical protein I4F81_004014 [Pyropia yezoensis]|uniref:Uncharacterized protein n=1 Tax=Pyropia yezoensis TaxID=2788 RepID=A0ACC3BU65_PYRYE|nr:hypothetical protein I4F81_004014 [Neopyropia yezoensis]